MQTHSGVEHYEKARSLMQKSSGRAIHEKARMKKLGKSSEHYAKSSGRAIHEKARSCYEKARMKKLGAFMKTLGAFMKKLGAFMKTLGKSSGRTIHEKSRAVHEKARMKKLGAFMKKLGALCKKLGQGNSRKISGTGILVNTWEDFEPVHHKAIREHSFFLQLLTPPVYPVGPLIKQDEPLSSSDEECLTWLDNQPADSVLFIGLGSGGTLTTEQLLEMAWGLEMSKQKFIWVLRKPDDADAFSTLAATLTIRTRICRKGSWRRQVELGRWVFVSLWLELDDGEYNSRCPDNSLAALRGAEDERCDADGRDSGGYETGEGTGRDGGQTRRDQ
ncbi:hypothetical protein Dsin_003444 [Dipteronia sinensis]|uniref:Uncharacterized protein n=1 Tax=Dipteronia sinensis TaxID=43782 RepID=A0AAE0EK87_9ROSI|nr:hypothetical protein Dsin_003444 [Dipteronia sinensis]